MHGYRFAKDVRGKIEMGKGCALISASASGLNLLRQLACLTDKLSHFKWLYEVGNVVLLQESPSLAGFHAVREGVENMLLHALAILCEPRIGFLGAPLTRHFAIHDDGVEWF